ncbi:3-oxoacyl-ACP reductase FabG [Candidatus Williamhamiltonella defendens]|uniref:3-oxoacyl-[acyl-carrier-protein] reductase n=1 Tax=Candidatus Hamiltonella defensa (Bemisia tabaci) TaxID=672795 RepID=A0A249DY12_9ENTR|nr:3-oxoacyl-ACP reductase FabG [Candidatus Hamiltonella defensa]ASX26418.1 3-oxoacyl-[acyl-carrier-protein] reductase [Candidatus Hamiltonella defensa (Bemisia tabaci)]CED78825.1 3-oxoacyl-(acyl-carrier-protein) reductase [Candidatus Hamiltonella defensa (Bemisia tabaci)]
MRFKGKIALITGATRGIGRAIAQSLTEEGAFVIGTATTEEGAKKISDDLGDYGKGVTLNVIDEESIEALIKIIEEEFCGPDILVNNAGITRDGLLMRMKKNSWNEVLGTNLTSIFYLSRAALRPMMKKRFGRIINIGSVVGSAGNAGQTNYAAAKAGLIGFSKSLAQEVAQRGITVNVIAPGFIETDMSRQALTETRRTEILKKVPMNRLGNVKDIANAVVFLASEQSSYITGETLHINGGMYMI